MNMNLLMRYWDHSMANISKIVIFPLRSVDDTKMMRFRSSNLDTIQPMAKLAVFNNRNVVKNKSTLASFHAKRDELHLMS